MPTVELGDICEFLDHRRKPVSEELRTPGPFPYYGANGQQGWINDYIFDETLVLLAEDGGHFGSRTSPIAYKVSGKTWVNNHAHVLRPLDGCDADYLTHVLSFYDVTKLISGTTRLKLTKGNAEMIRIPLPDLSEQRRIAGRLEQADRLRRTRRYALELTDTFLPAAFIELFGDYLTPACSSVLNNVLALPLSNGFFGRNSLYGTGVPVIWVDNLYHTMTIDLENLRRARATAEQITAFRVMEGDLLFTRSSLVREGIGQVNIVPRLSEPALFECHVIRARVDANRVNPFYVLGLYRSSFGKAHILTRANTATMTTISQGALEELPCPLPPLPLQQEFAAMVEQVEHLRAVQREALRQAEHLFASLLHHAFSGDP